MTATALSLLDASTLCAISTISPRGRPHINTAYFAWDTDLRVVWLSDPGAQHSRNIGVAQAASVAVYDSSQTWGGPDRGIQLFGSAVRAIGRSVREAQRTYAGRFREFDAEDFADYRFYVLRPRLVKLFDEQALGAGVFVTAKVGAEGRFEWERTEIYHAA